MKKIIIAAILVLALMEGVSLWVYKTLVSKDAGESAPSAEQTPNPVPPSQSTNGTDGEPATNQSAVSDVPPASSAASVSESFPPPSTEVVNGVTERTIHVGVRQWEWDPKVIRVKQGELVRLIIHNADVRHTLVIPDLQIDVDIPEDGAVATFTATKKGTFDFLCGTYCGIGHAEMQGTLVIE